MSKISNTEKSVIHLMESNVAGNKQGEEVYLVDLLIPSNLKSYVRSYQGYWCLIKILHENLINTTFSTD